MRVALVAQLSKAADAHKYDHGHALVLTGGAGQTGAARLAARGALRVGAGLVTLGPPGAALMECAVHSTAVMVRRCNDAEALEALLADRRINALCLGPGSGVERAASLLPAALAGTAAEAGRSLLLDADALTALGPLTEPLPTGSVLTPHGGEFARLFPDVPHTAEGVRTAAERAGAVILLKGPVTRIAAPKAYVEVATKSPWLATAGSGDVLAGIITGLLARGFAPFEAAEAGAELHGAAARAFGPGLIAEDLPETLPQVFAELGL